MTDTREIVLTADTMDAYIALFGLNDRNISVIEQECSVHIALRGNHLLLQGDEAHLSLAEETIRILFGMISRNEPVDRLKIRYVISMVRDGNADRIEESLKKVIAITHRGKQITCKTIGQQNYIDTIRKNTLTFAVGPAGTGKTYLAMALSVMALKNKEAELQGKPHEVSGMLLYARTDEAFQPDNVYHMSGNKISVKTLALNRPFAEISAQLDQIAAEHFS